MALANALSLVLVVLVNALANILPIAGITTGEVSDSYVNLFAPAGITFSIWGVIYALLIGFTVLLILPRILGEERHEELLRRVSFWFIAANVLNSLWIFAWHYRWIGTSLLLIVGVFLTVGALYLILRRFPTQTWAEKLFIPIPFQIYFGWLTVAVIANITTYLVAIEWGGFGLPDALWTVVVIAAAAVIGSLVIWTKKDVFYTAVVIWALFGIILKRAGAQPIEWFVIVAAGLAIIGLVCMIYWQILLRRFPPKSKVKPEVEVEIETGSEAAAEAEPEGETETDDTKDLSAVEDKQPETQAEPQVRQDPLPQTDAATGEDEEEDELERRRRQNLASPPAADDGDEGENGS